MPIVDGKYEAKISTIFRTVEEGIDELKNKIDRSRKIRISGIPMPLLNELVPKLEGKDVKIILPLNSHATDELRKLGDVGVTKAKIYKVYKGVDAFSGSVSFADVIFNITWAVDKILEIDTMEYSKCVKCMKGTFDGAWHYADKS